MRSIIPALLTISVSITAAFAAPKCDADNGGIKLPEKFCAQLAAQGIGAGRHAVVAPNGDLYVALMSDRNSKGGVAALRDADHDGKFEVVEHFGDLSSTGIALRNSYLYVATVNSVIRYKMTAGQLKPSGEAEVVVADLPGQREHGDKGLTFDGKGFLYVNVGSPSNACQAQNRRKGVPGQDPCPIRSSTAASGASTKTSSARKKPTAYAGPPVFVRSLRLLGMTASSTL